MFYTQEQVVAKLKEIEPLKGEFDRVCSQIRELMNKKDELERQMEKILPNHRIFNPDGMPLSRKPSELVAKHEAAAASTPPKVEVVEVKGEGFHALLGKHIIVLCANYNYAGKLVGINDINIKLEDCVLVYNTGAWKDQDWNYAEQPNTKDGTGYVQIGAIESFFEGKPSKHAVAKKTP